MTSDEKLLVTENHNLIYGFCAKYKLDVDDWYGILAIEMCESAKDFDPNIGTFSTYYYSRCYNKMLNVIRDTKKPEDLIAFQSDNLDESRGIPKLSTHSDPEVFKMDIKGYISQLADHEILELHIEGYTQGEIAEKLNVSRATINRKLQCLKKELKEWLERE